MEVYVGFAGLKRGFWLSKCIFSLIDGGLGWIHGVKWGFWLIKFIFINKPRFRVDPRGKNEVFD